MFANGQIPTVTDDEGRIYIDLVGVIWHIMSSSMALSQGETNDDEQEAMPFILDTLDYITLAMLQLLQFEIERRNFDSPDQFIEMLDKLTKGQNPYI